MPELIESVNLLEELAGHTAEFALFTTYAIDLAFFESKILYELQKNNEGIKTVILLDRNSYSESALSGRHVRKAEAEYRLIPVDTAHGVFHPKVFFLCGKDWATLYVGSANLTEPGFSQNLEVIDKTSTGLNNERNTGCFATFAQFLGQLKQLIPANYASAVTEFQTKAEAFSKSNPSSDFSFSTSLNGSAFDQFISTLPPDIEELTIVSPFHDENSHALNCIADRFPKAFIKLIITGDACPVNIKTISKKHKNQIQVFTFKNSHLADRRLHAKVILAKNSKKSFLLSGSMNLTTPGFVFNYQKGNVEAWTIRTGSKTEYDFLFSDKFSLKPVTKDLVYIPLARPEKDASLGIHLSHASYDEEDLRLILEPGKIFGKYHVIALVNGYFGCFSVEKEIHLSPETKSHILNLPLSPNQKKQMRAACSASILLKDGKSTYSSNAIWIELSALLNEDPGARRLRESIEDFEQLIFEQDPSQNRRSIKFIVRAISEWLREFQHGRGKISPASTATKEKEKASGYGSIPYEGETPGSTTGAGGMSISLFSQVVSTLDRLSQTEPQVVRKAKGKPADDSESQNDVLFPKKIADAIVFDLSSGFTEILHSIRKLNPNNLNELDIGLKTIQLLFNLSFVVNITLAQNDDTRSDDLQEQSVRAYLNQCSRIMDICFLGRHDGGEYLPGWLSECTLTESLPNFQARHKKLLYASLTFVLREISCPENANKGQLLRRYRGGLSLLEKLFRINNELIEKEWPEVLKFIEFQNKHCTLFNKDLISKETLQKYISEPTQDQYIKKTFEPVKILIECDKKIIKSGPSVSPSIIDERAVSLEMAEKHPSLESLITEYLRIKARCANPKEIMFFVDPDTVSCPRCHMALPGESKNLLANPEKWTKCRDCNALLLGLNKYFGGGDGRE